MKSKIKIGSRGSKLALWQSNFVKDKLQECFPDIEIEILEIKTKGDKILDVSLNKVGGKGLFTKEIEDALIAKEVDIAVHSLKDLPTVLPEGLQIGAVLNREDSSDVLIVRRELRSAVSESLFFGLQKGAKIGTSSLRRSAQLKHLRPDLEYLDLRGNVDTRIRKLQEGKYDAIVLAYAGVKRLGYIDDNGQFIVESGLESNLIYEKLDLAQVLPAAGQGALAIEVREDDEDSREVVAKLNDINAYLTTLAERAFLEKMMGGCQTPIGVYSEINNGMLTLHGVIGSLDGKQLVNGSEKASLANAVYVGTKLAEKLLTSGGGQILIGIMTDVGEL